MLKTEFCMPFSELATHDVKLSQEFKGKLKNGREICITRGDWECAPCPICTMVLSDETMNTILNRVIAELNTYEFQAETDDDFGEAFWKEYERITIQYASYYEDLPNLPLPVGTKVFDTTKQIYAVVVKSSVAGNTDLDNGEQVFTDWLIAEY